MALRFFSAFYGNPNRIPKREGSTPRPRFKHRTWGTLRVPDIIEAYCGDAPRIARLRTCNPLPNREVGPTTRCSTRREILASKLAKQIANKTRQETRRQDP